MAVAIGLDCGGSNSRALAVDSNGNQIFNGNSGAANLASTPLPRLRRNLTNCLSGAPKADFICGCFAGQISEETRLLGESILAEIQPGAKIKVLPDYAAALQAAPAGTDLLVISGTGSLVCSRIGDQYHKSGGGGYILGDEGSGYRFGRRVLAEFMHRPNESSESVRKLVQQTFGTLHVQDVVLAVYRASTPASIIAKLAKGLAQDAADGMEYAMQGIVAEFSELAMITRHHINEHFGDRRSIQLCLSGGVWKLGAAFRSEFERQLSMVTPDLDLTIVRIERPPLMGAVELARELGNGN